MTIDASTLGVSSASPDNGTALYTAFQAGIARREPVLLPPGVLHVFTPFPQPLTGAALTIWGQDTEIHWNAKTDAVLLPVTSLGRLKISDVAFDGGGVASKLIEVTPGTVAGWTPTLYALKRLELRGVAPGGIGFHIGGDRNCDTFRFEQVRFCTGVKTQNFRSDNANALDHLFSQCNFSSADYGMVWNGGSFKADCCSFDNNAQADCQLYAFSPSEFCGGWSQNSYRFLSADFRSQVSALRIQSMALSSFPFDYIRTHPTVAMPQNWFDQRAIVNFDRVTSLQVVNSWLLDAANKEPVYVRTQTYPKGLPLDWANDGSHATDGQGGWTRSFFAHGDSVL